MKRIRHYLTWLLMAVMLVNPFIAKAAQHDFEITTADANTGVTFRAAVNASLQALASLSSGATAPSTTYAFQLWADTGNDQLKIRNAANSGWIVVGKLSEIYFGLASLSVQNDFTATQKIKGDALLLRIKDTGTSGEEWGIRSDGGNFEVLKNTGTEGSPAWTVQARIDVNALRIGDGTSSDIRLIANNSASAKPEIRYSNTVSKWQYSDNGSTFYNLSSSSGSPSGTIIAFMGSTAPVGYLECDGSAISMTTYEALYDVIANDYGLNTGTTFTADNTTETFTASAHGLSNDSVLEVKNSGGALPTGITANTKYYVVNATTDTFQLSASKGGAALAISDNGSGTNTFHNQFLVPDLRGRFLRGWAHGSSTDPDRASRTDRGDGTTGDYVGTLQGSMYGYHAHSHLHSFTIYSLADGTSIARGSAGGGNAATKYTSTDATPSGGNETRPVNINVMFCIKY